ncbi:MAG: 50S ribosomal protein L2 [Candidatus Kerfeldbacteria bacterium RIFOXYC2_FULL_38_9]|nr:MAG: 50S ribosomal protein L2 [Candidatus Kerfeldbacteria bacterium RIFOXYC2_FULL_38_9]
MAVKKYKPTSAGRRLSSGDSFSDITKHTPEKKLTVAIKKQAGRNNQGKSTVRHRGGGVKRRYRLIDFHQERFDETATVVGIEYDPNRSSRVALIEYKDKVRVYIVAAEGLMAGAQIISATKGVDLKPGNRMPLEFITSGTLVHNIELFPGKGGTLMRSAGSSAVVMSQEGGFVQLKMASGEIRKFSEKCHASIGKVSNSDWGMIRWGKAGRIRHRGFRPTVRGKVMNPVDHPHGGGEGSSPVGMKHPKTPQGKPALGVKTRKAHKESDAYIVTGRKKKKRNK